MEQEKGAGEKASDRRDLPPLGAILAGGLELGLGWIRVRDRRKTKRAGCPPDPEALAKTERWLFRRER